MPNRIQMTVNGMGRAVAIGGSIITAVVLALFAISFLLSAVLRFPLSLGLPIVVRLVGGAILVIGLAVMGWTFQNRSPANVILSTFITFTKALRRIPAAEKAGRTEPLVVTGPQRYTRNPLYFGVIVMVLGWALLTAYSFVFVATLVLLIWFGVIVIPFEERELDALFGEDWRRYAEETPMLFPFTKRRRHSTATSHPPSSSREKAAGQGTSACADQYQTIAYPISVRRGRNL